MELAFTVGLPLSGKSTWVNFNWPFQVVCPDDIRLAFGHEFYGPLEPVVWSTVETMVRAHMIRRQYVLVDATNITKYERSKWVRMCKDVAYEHDIHYRPVAYLCDTHFAVCKERAISAERTHMVSVIERMKKKAQALNKDEGFEIRRINKAQPTPNTNSQGKSNLYQRQPGILPVINIHWKSKGIR